MECKSWTDLITETDSETMKEMVWVEVRALALALSKCVFIKCVRVCQRVRLEVAEGS